MSELIDISDSLDPFSVPCCPLCDNAIMEFDSATMVIAHGSKTLVHTDCLPKDQG